MQDKYYGWFGSNDIENKEQIEIDMSDAYSLIPNWGLSRSGALS